MNRDAVVLLLIIIGALLCVAGCIVIWSVPGGLISAGAFTVSIGVLLGFGN